jgi:hypothetical protein
VKSYAVMPNRTRFGSQPVRVLVSHLVPVGSSDVCAHRLQPPDAVGRPIGGYFCATTGSGNPVVVWCRGLIAVRCGERRVSRELNIRRRYHRAPPSTSLSLCTFPGSTARLLLRACPFARFCGRESAGECVAFLLIQICGARIIVRNEEFHTSFPTISLTNSIFYQKQYGAPPSTGLFLCALIA